MSNAMYRLRIAGVAVSAALLLAATGCGSDDKGDATAITATDTECRVAVTELKSGRNTFSVENSGSQITEVYVYGEGDKVISEKEDIGPKTKATFSADLPPGSYEIACKPGQTGTGIRQAVTVTAEGSSAPAS